jgi:hypothetical protein
MLLKSVSFVCNCAMLIALVLPTASARDGKTYKHLVVESLEVPAGTDFPPEFEESLRHNLVRHLQASGRFDVVSSLGPGEAIPDDADIVMTGKILRFNKGSRAERYMVPGLGTTSLRAQIEFIDPSSKKSLFQKEVSGHVVMGLFGGDSKGATNGLAKGVVKVVKKDLP